MRSPICPSREMATHLLKVTSRLSKGLTAANKVDCSDFLSKTFEEQYKYFHTNVLARVHNLSFDFFRIVFFAV